MKRSKKSNRVSWATGGNLCQVKLFLSEDYPCKVSLKSQDHLQPKTSSVLYSSLNEPNDLPPGFERSHFPNQPTFDFSHISMIKWECPPLFVSSPHWRVAAGEESREKDVQKLREMKVLEAVYPRLSAIPPSPSVSLDVGQEDYDDINTPLVSIIPIEEEESMNNFPEFTVAGSPPHNVQSQNSQIYVSTASRVSSGSNSSNTVLSDASVMPIAGVSPGLEADLAAVSSVVASIMKINEQAKLVDMDLLVKILNNPGMVEILIKQHIAAAPSKGASSNTVDIPTSASGLKPAIPSVPLSRSTPDLTVPGITPASTAGFLPSELKSATPSVSLLNPTPDKVATMSAFAIPSGKPVTSSVLPPTSTTPAPHMHRPVNINIHHMPNGMPPALNTQPLQDTVLASGMKRSASLASLSSTEYGSVPLHPGNVNFHAVANQSQSAVSTMPYQQSTAPTSYAVKDANYYKNLIRQHGAAGNQEMQDSQIGIRHNNFQDLKPVHNTINQGEAKHKNQKPCIYYKSSRGCRNGSDCPYLHEGIVQWGPRNMKKLKLGPEI